MEFHVCDNYLYGHIVCIFQPQNNLRHCLRLCGYSRLHFVRYMCRNDLRFLRLRIPIDTTWAGGKPNYIQGMIPSKAYVRGITTTCPLRNGNIKS